MQALKQLLSSETSWQTDLATPTPLLSPLQPHLPPLPPDIHLKGHSILSAELQANPLRLRNKLFRDLLKSPSRIIPQ